MTQSKVIGSQSSEPDFGGASNFEPNHKIASFSGCSGRRAVWLVTPHSLEAGEANWVKKLGVR